MINAYSRSVSLNANAIVPFNSVVLQKGCSDTIVGTSSVQLNKSGIYKVEFYAEALAGSAGNVAFAMSTNGTQKTQDTTTITGATTTSTVTVPIVTLVQVPHNDCKCKCCSNPTTLQFINTGVATTSDINLIITKIV